MSSRALRQVSSSNAPVEDDIEDSEEDELLVAAPRKSFNAFAALGGDDNDDDDDDDAEDDVDGGGGGAAAASQPKASKNKKKKKKKKKAAAAAAAGNLAEPASPAKASTGGVGGAEEVERCVQEVNSLLGVSSSVGAASSASSSALPSLDTRGLLCVDHRHLNANNEMKRIFGARVVRSDRKHGGRREGRSTKKTGFIVPNESWPKFGRSGLSMDLVEHKGSYYHFAFEHNEHYRQTQTAFWESVDSMNPDAIAAVLRQHPYHVDSLLQLAEICKMNEDRRAAAELIERALFALEGGFHTLFNVATGCNRLDFKKTENRAFFLALFRHLNMVGLRGCYRTSLEFCKLLLSLEPDTDPLCVLLILDFYALRAGEYQFLIRMSNEWEAHHRLSKLPNMSYSCALARYHASGASIDTKQTDEDLLASANVSLETSLLQFPMVLVPLLDRCGVIMESVTGHSFFASASVGCPDALERVCRLYIERTHSVWKEPEVLTWLEECAVRVTQAVDTGDSRVMRYRRERTQLYQKTPRNVLRHIIVSDLPNVSAFLPPDVASESIMMYDPLPPADSYASYKRPERRTMAGASNAGLLQMFLQSLSPNFDPAAPVEDGGQQPPGRISLDAQGLRTMAQLVTQAAREAGVGNALHRLLDVLQINVDGDADAAAVEDGNHGDVNGEEEGENEEGEEIDVHPGFNAGDYAADDDFEFD